MNGIDDFSAWREVFLQEAQQLTTDMASFLPRLLGALLILLAGWALAWGCEMVARRGLQGLGLDRASARVRMNTVLDRAGIERPPSALVGTLVFWLVLLAFGLSAASVLGVDALSSTVDRIVAFVPDLIAAGLTLLLGLLLARFAASVVSSAAAATGLGSAPRLGLLVHLLVGGLVVVAAAEQLGVATGVLVGPLTALVAAAGLSAGLAFALGAHPIVTHILAGHFLKQSLPRDGFIEVAGERGVVERVGATDTVLRSGERSWSVPNAKLLGEVVGR